MEAETENVVLNIDERNEVVFDVNIQSSSPIAEKPIYRLVVEDSKEEIAYSFRGQSAEEGKIAVDIPIMKNKLTEGGKYKASLEVIVENKIFTPMSFELIFEKPLKIEVKKVSSSYTSKAKSDKKQEIKVESRIVSGGSLKDLYEKKKITKVL